MKPELYHEVALKRDVRDAGLRAGDVAIVVDYVADPGGGEDGAVLEIFNALGEKITVVTVPVSAIMTLSADQIPAVRQRVQTG